MILNPNSILHQGAFADIFVIEGKAYKLFISFQNPRSNKNDYKEDLFNARSQRASESEAGAYAAIASSVLLLRFTPTYFGRIEITGVVDDNGLDVSQRYILVSCYCMSYHQGNDYKRNVVLGNPAVVRQLSQLGFYWQQITTEFHICGVNFIEDISFIFGSNNDTRMIDFSLEDFNTNFIIEQESGPPYDGIDMGKF